ncbi:hypothetical protein FALBO_3833 [Fusarium albosuccineum]|uniref:Uncharacterized protein n=1 Tax=Fusarium albosuccineum TaxID=1237068 RepID=A0A8H4LGL4_9HYPO|nr:hypothetical protein FALBO_3833 [Fusarium albosuccineum]
MASEIDIECSLNTTECILETIASILSEIQELNSEYNWDPLTFMFTATIGFVAITFAALAVLQAFLAAGPGRTKSGPYAIGPWSHLNDRKFDWADMRFRTISSTPVLTVDSLKDDLPGRSSTDVVNIEILRKGPGEYFPATWLAMLTILRLDNTDRWKTRLTGADYIPAEFLAVPAYGSINFVTVMAVILSQGTARLTVDKDSGLPRVQARNFNLIFRNHPSLGGIGFFEMCGEMPPKHSISPNEIRIRLLNSQGHMDISENEPEPGEPKVGIKGGKQVRIRCSLSNFFANKVQQGSIHSIQEPELACYGLHEGRSEYQASLFEDGPLYLFLSYLPHPKLLPVFFPHKKAKFRERLDLLLLQSPFWLIEPSVRHQFFPNWQLEVTNPASYLAMAATSLANVETNSPTKPLKLEDEPFTLCSDYLADSAAFEYQSGEERLRIQQVLQKELSSIDVWLKQRESHVLCRKLTLSVLGNNIKEVIHGTCRHSNLVKASVSSLARRIRVRPWGDVELPQSYRFVSSALYDKLLHFLSAMNRLKHPAGDGLEPGSSLEFASLIKIQDLWELKETSSEEGSDENREMPGGSQPQLNRRSRKITDRFLVSLDDLLIYRAMLLALTCLLTIDSSPLVGEDSYNLVVPIM